MFGDHLRTPFQPLQFSLLQSFQFALSTSLWTSRFDLVAFTKMNVIMTQLKIEETLKHCQYTHVPVQSLLIGRLKHETENYMAMLSVAFFMIAHRPNCCRLALTV